MAVATGPLVPGEGFSYQPQAVTATKIRQLGAALSKGSS